MSMHVNLMRLTVVHIEVEKSQNLDGTEPYALKYFNDLILARPLHKQAVSGMTSVQLRKVEAALPLACVEDPTFLNPESPSSMKDRV
jgi:hypothetical protein